MGFINRFLKTSLIIGIAPMLLVGAQSPNPRAGNVAKNVRSQDIENSAMLRRSAAPVIARTVSSRNRQSRAVVTARPATTNTKVRSVRSVTKGVAKTRGAMQPTLGRSGTVVKKSTANVSRAGTARATAVFNDITKIGGGYSDCRDSYATCMDQMCANANDTYRRCFCSDRFSGFRETADRLDSALTLLAEFQDNNLNAVDKTAAEVNAMYTATAGEEAIKKDTSASQKLLDSIGDALSGKSNKKQSTNSLGLLDFSMFSNNNDIFDTTSSLFGGSDSTDISDLEGKALYDKASKQCSEISRAACGSDAMFNLAKSAYSIMITQDCNAYEKNINAKKASVEETVRTAEKYLREARLDEYRAHNSADVNECLTKVENALRQSTACGEDYEKCMDYTGLYINSSTGEPIYSQALFGLNNLIKLDGSADVLGANPDFNKMLDNKKMFATTALDSCRDLADTVWYEFKRSAIIQIAQAQDEKIQQVKDSCVMTIKECYDTQTGALKEMDTTTTNSTGAIATVTARGMCYDRVQACAALYGDPNGCVYDDETKKLSNKSSTEKCGLQSLLTFVDTVDSVNVAEGCEAALTKYAKEICPDKDMDDGTTIAYGSCANKPKAEIQAAMELRRKTFCASDLVNADNSNTLQASGGDAFNTNIMNQIIKGIYDAIGIGFTAGCEETYGGVSGEWVNTDEIPTINTGMLLQDFYKKYYGRTITTQSQLDELKKAGVGYCINASEKAKCEDLLGETYAEYTGGECKPKPEWYEDMCQDALGGSWQNNKCVITYGQYNVGNQKRNKGTDKQQESVLSQPEYQQDVASAY